MPMRWHWSPGPLCWVNWCAKEVTTTTKPINVLSVAAPEGMRHTGRELTRVLELAS